MRHTSSNRTPPGSAPQVQRPLGPSSTARALGEVSENEVTRTDHSGFAFQTDSPLSNKPLNEKVEFVIYG